MNQLLYEVNGWLGYLQRDSVVLQLVAVLLPMLVGRIFLMRHHPRTRERVAILTVVVGLVALVTGLLALFQQRYGLSLFILKLCVAWYGIRLLALLLRRSMSAHELQRLDAQILRPIFYIGAILALINHLDSLDDLAVIPVVEMFGQSMNLGKIFTFLVILYFILIGSRPIAIGLAWVFQKAFGLGQDSHRALQLLTRYGLVGIAILWVASDLGVNPTGILALTGGLSLGLGFGVKEVFSNFVSGLWLLMEGSVRPGDILFIKGEPCEVRSLGLRAALLWRSHDNAEILVPNQIFFSSETTTYTGTDRTRRSEINVSAAYRHDPSVVIKILEETASQIKEIMPEPRPKAILYSYGDSGINYSLRYFVPNPMNAMTAYSHVGVAIWKNFAARGIEIPFPQQVQYNVDGAPQDSTPQA